MKHIINIESNFVLMEVIGLEVIGMRKLENLRIPFIIPPVSILQALSAMDH